MKLLHIFKSVYCIALLASQALSAYIIEAPHFSDIKAYATPGTLIILDMDDTLLIPIQTLGSDVWFEYRLKQRKATGMAGDVALEKTLAEYEAIRHLSIMKTVESDTADIVNEMQDQGIAVIGLTTQGISLATRTKQQLQAVNIDLKRSCPDHEDYYFINPLGLSTIYSSSPTSTIGHVNDHRGVLLRGGILFTAGSNKGTALVTLLDHFGISWDRIVFINDKASHLREAEAAVERLGIPFIGLRYSYSDERVRNFRSDIAEVQFQHSTFKHILSDDEALSVLSRP